GDAWRFTIDEVVGFFERVLTQGEGKPPPELPAPLVDLVDAAPPPEATGMIGAYVELSRLLGRRTAELHAALASIGEGNFDPDPYTALTRRSYYQSVRNLASRSFDLLKERVRSLPEGAAEVARQV